MGQVIDLQKYKKTEKQPPPPGGIPFHVVLRENQPFAVVVVSFAIIFALDLANIIHNNHNGDIEFSMMNSTDFTRLRVYQWSSKNHRVHGYEYNMYPVNAFNLIPDFGYINCRFVAFGGTYLGKVDTCSREEFILRYRS
jgi:hypothetical protein